MLRFAGQAPGGEEVDHRDMAGDVGGRERTGIGFERRQVE